MTKHSVPFLLLETDSKRPGFYANVFKTGKHKEPRTKYLSTAAEGGACAESGARRRLILSFGSYRCCLVARSCLTLGDPVDGSLPGFSVHGISQARILEQVTISSSRGSS